MTGKNNGASLVKMVTIIILLLSSVSCIIQPSTGKKEKIGKSATVHGVEIEFLEYKVFEQGQSNPTIWIKYRLKNTTNDKREFLVISQANFTDGSSIYSAKDDSNYLKKEYKPNDYVQNNVLPNVLAPNGQLTGWTAATIAKNSSKIKMVDINSDITVYSAVGAPVRTEGKDYEEINLTTPQN